MTDNDIIRWALEAGGRVEHIGIDIAWLEFMPENLERFAALVAAAEREAYAKLAEPVAWMVYTLDGQSAFVTDNPADFTQEHRVLPLYTAPPKREPLTDEQITELFHGNNDQWWRVDHHEFCSIARAIERAHGISANDENSVEQLEQKPVAGEYAICLEDGERVLISAVLPVGYGGNKTRTVHVVWPDGMEGAFSLFSFSKLFSPASLKGDDK